jgi:hypothetical protein
MNNTRAFHGQPSNGYGGLMSEEELRKARELITNRDYEGARAILQTIDHPEARFLLMYLPASVEDFPEMSTRFTALESDADEPVDAGPEE